MTAAEILAQATQLGFEVRLNSTGDGLILWPGDDAPIDLVALLKASKPEIVAVLQAERGPADAGDRGLTARACRREPPLLRNTRTGNHVFTRPVRNSILFAERPLFSPRIAIIHTVVFVRRVFSGWATAAEGCGRPRFRSRLRRGQPQPKVGLSAYGIWLRETSFRICVATASQNANRLRDRERRAFCSSNNAVLRLGSCSVPSRRLVEPTEPLP